MFLKGLLATFSKLKITYKNISSKRKSLLEFKKVQLRKPLSKAHNSGENKFQAAITVTRYFSSSKFKLRAISNKISFTNVWQLNILKLCYRF